MKVLLLGCCFLYLSAMEAESKPQITKLYPVAEEREDPFLDLALQSKGEELTSTTSTASTASGDAKPLDRLLGKLRATYNFVFRKPEDTGNVERILAKDAPNPDVQAFRLIWSTRAPTAAKNTADTELNFHLGDKMLAITGDNDWINDIRPLEPLAPLELEEEDKNREVETVTPTSSLQLPVTLSRHLVEWLGSLLGLTYNVYAKIARAVHTDNKA